MFFIVMVLMAAIAAVIVYRLGRHHGTLSHFPERIAKTVEDLNSLKSRLEGEHQAIVLEKNEMLSTAKSVRERLDDLVKEQKERITNIDASLKSISSDAVGEVKNMSGVIQPVIAMFKTPQTAGIQYAEAELELLLKTHLGEGLYERKPAWLAVGNESVDFVLKLPDVVIPIDSKFPEAVYRVWVEAKDEGEAKPKWRLFRDAILKQMESTTKYIRPEAGTTDYALLFLPSDAIWKQAFTESRWYGEENPIVHRSQELRVFGCSAQTLMPYIGLLRLGLRNLKISDDVKAVRRQIDQLSTSFGRFARDWGTLRKHLTNAQNAASEAEGPKGSFSALQRGVERLSDHEQGEADLSRSEEDLSEALGT